MKKKLFPIFTLIILLAQSYSPLLFTVMASIQPELENEAQVEATLPATEAPVDPSPTTEPTATEEPTAIPTEEPTTQATEEPTLTPTEVDTIGEILDGISTERPEVVPTPTPIGTKQILVSVSSEDDNFSTNAVTSLPAIQNGCLKEVTGGSLTCSANDISLANVTNIQIIDDGCQAPGDTVTFSGNFNVITTATNRYDIGLYFSTDGDPNNDGSKSGQCNINALPTYRDLDGDQCGDIKSEDNPLSTPITLTVVCLDNGQNQLKLPYCSSWNQNAGGVCTDAKGTSPGAPSKCNCDEGFTVPITVPYGAKIEVIKNVNPTNDPGKFNLLIDNVVKKANAGHLDTTGKVSVGAGTSANPGATHTVGETAYTGTSLTDYTSTISCVDRAKATFNGGAPLTLQGASGLQVPVDKDDDIVCTITNARKTVKLDITKVVNWNGITPDVTKTFEICVTGPSYSVPNCKNADYDGGTLTWDAVLPGDYVVTETNPGSGWTVTGSGQTVVVGNTGGTGTITNALKVADLGVVKTADQATYMRGDTVTYSLVVTNYGPNTAVNSTLSDNVPVGLTFVSVNTTQGSCSQNLGTVSCNFGDILKDGTVTVTVVATVNSDTSGDVKNTGTVDSDTPDSDETNNSDDETVKVVYLTLDVTKTDSPDPVYPGQEITYTINWSVTGNTQAKDIKLVEIVDKTLVSVDLSDPQNAGWTACGDNYCYAIGDKSTPANGSVTFVVTVIKPTSATTIPNTVDLFVDAPLGNTELKDTAQASTAVLQYGAISGYKYDDKNGNGTWNEGDTGLQSWTIFIDANNDNIQNPSEKYTQTNASGFYSFTNLLPGDYIVCEILNSADGWVNKSPLCTTVSVTNGNTTSNTNFFNFKCVNISGLKWEDLNGDGDKDEGEPIVAGVTINLTGADTKTTTTNEKGEYSFRVCNGGDVSIDEVNPDSKVWYKTYPATDHDLTLVSGGTYNNYNFGNAKFAEIYGYKYRDINGNGVLDSLDLSSTLSGWVIELYDGLTNVLIGTYQTLADGYYEFTGLLAGRQYYVLEKQQSGWTQTFGPIVKSLIDTTSGSETKVEFANFQNMEIKVCKYDDTDGSLNTTNDHKAIEGWSVSLLKGESKDTKQTGSDGCYTWTNLTPGSYSVEETVTSGWSALTPTSYNFGTIENGKSYTYKFVNTKLGGISGMKFEDLNANGVKDAGEPAVQGVKICLEANTTGIGGTCQAGEPSQLTDASGAYEFTNLQPGTYQVTEDIAQGGAGQTWYQSYPGLANSYRHANIVLSSGEAETGYNFGNYKLAEICYQKFNDLNGNGVKDAGEPDLANWVFKTYEMNQAGAKVELDGTNTSGTCRSNLMPGKTYFVSEVLQNGWTQTTPSGDGFAGPFNATSDSTHNAVFGNVLKGNVTIIKNTLGGNTKFTFETSTLPGGNFDLTTVSNTAKKDFNGIIAGTYSVKELLPAGWDLTGLVCNDPDKGSSTNLETRIATIDLDAGETITCTFTNTQRGSITAHKFQDDDLNMQQGAGEVDLKDWQMTLYKGSGCVNADMISSSTTNIDGDVLFSNLAPGSYSVRETLQSGYLNTTTLCQNVTLDAGEADTVNFGNYILGEITVCKYNDTNGDGLTTGDSKLAGWTINLEGPSDYDESKITGENGCVTFDDLRYGRYTYSEDLKNGWVETKPAGGKTYTVSVDADNLTHNLVLTNYSYGSISGMKFEDVDMDGVKDAGEKGLSGWTINLDKNADGSVDSTTTTDANGNYSFSNLTYATYRVREVQQDDWKQTTTNPTDINISSGVESKDNNFGNYKYGLISGMKFEDTDMDGIKDPGEKGLSGWTINLDKNADGVVDLTILTDANGNYSYTQVEYGTYRLREVQQNGWTQTTTNPVDINISSGVESKDNNFGNYKYGLISGMKFEDTDMDGVKDPGEKGLSGWTINLDKDANGSVEASTTTDVDGKYSFTNLGFGTYRVREVQQNGWTQTTTNPSDINISSGVESKDNNFGNYRYGSISGMKFEDTDMDGVKDPGEKGLLDWTINLDKNADGSVDLTTKTDANGNYSFTNLGFGTYRVREVQQNGWIQTTTNPSDINISSRVESKDNNFGNYKYGSISGMKFEDKNDNGVKDALEPGLKDWTINLDKNADGSVDATIKTDANGNYTFTNLEFATYRVREVLQTNWKQTTTNPLDINISSGVDSTGNNFGNFKFGDVTVWKYEDMDFEPGKDENDPYLGDPTFTFRLYKQGSDSWSFVAEEDTNENGEAEFLGKVETLGEYYICEVTKEGWDMWSDLVTPVTNESGAEDEYPLCEKISVTSSGFEVDLAFGNVELGEIFGFKWNDLNGNGEWDCNYLLDRIETNITVPQYCEPLLSDWEIFIDENDNSVHDEGEDSKITDGQGEYSFENLLPGTYTVCEVEQSGWYRTYPTEKNCQDIQIGTDGDTKEANFGNYEAGSISGWKYRDVNGNGELDWEEREAEDKVNKLNDWTINLYNSDWEIVKSMETGDDETEAGNVYKGQFKFVDLPMGDYYVCEELKDGWIQTEPREMLEFKPVELELEVQNNCYPVEIYESGQYVSRLYFGNFELGRVDGYKWDDLDGDGEWDEDEKGLENWTINLTKIEELEEPIEERLLASVIEVEDELSTETDEDGYYEFEGLTAGVYRVCEEQQDGWMQTAPFETDPTSTIILEEEEEEVDEYYGCWTFTVESGSEESVDFGNFKLGIIEGYKWNDLDGDGVKDTEETKLSGWEIQLWDEKLPLVEEKDMGEALLVGEPGNKIGTPIKTDTNGNFIFKDLEPGVYYVSEVLQSGWIQKHPVSPAYYRVVIDESGQVVKDIAFGNQAIPIPTPTPGRVLGEETPRVLGALAPTGRSILVSLLVGWSFIIALAVLDTKSKKEECV